MSGYSAFAVEIFLFTTDESVIATQRDFSGSILCLRRNDAVYFHSLKVFAPGLVDGFSLKFERQQSPLVSRTLLSILADPNNVVIWMVSTRSLISKSFSPCNRSFSDYTEHINYN